MRINITQQDINIFASDPLSTKEEPQGTDYTDGVDVGYTAPAKWWNWLWNKITSWFTACKTDRTSVYAELSNALTDAQITPSASDEHQLSKAVDKIEYGHCIEYNNETITETIGGVDVTHPVNKPYSIANTLYLPDTELL